jgi:hypothetical protein
MLRPAALPIAHPRIALDEKPGVHAPPNARALIDAFTDRFLRLLRLLGQFAAAGGPLS